MSKKIGATGSRHKKKFKETCKPDVTQSAKLESSLELFKEEETEGDAVRRTRRLPSRREGNSATNSG
jgi:hypothetical protein